MQPSGSVVRVQARSSRSSGGLIQALQQAQLYKKPKVVIPVLLWLFGLYAAFLSPSPRPISAEMQARFDAKVEEAQQLTEGLFRAEDTWRHAQMHVEEAQTWFWRFDKEKRAEVKKRQVVEKAARKELERLNSQQEQLLISAKRELGVWSEVGVAESRLLFWRSFEAGKVFGRRQTFWDAMINLITTSSGERNLLVTVLQLIFSAAINFTLGMIVCFFVYMWQLPGLLASYQASIISGLLFYIVALLGAASVIVGFLLCLYGVGATAVYSSVAIAASAQQRRLADVQRRTAQLREHAE